MNETLTISLDDSQGALLRVLGVIERRGWIVRALTVDSEGSNSIAMRCDIARRPFHAGGSDILIRHIEKLECVGRVGLAKPLAPRWAAPVGAPAPALHAVAAGVST